MLKYRIITAGCLIPLIVALVLYAPVAVLKIILAFILSLGFFEWIKLVNFNTAKSALLLSMIILIIWANDYMLFSTMGLLSVTVAWWLLGLLAVLAYGRGAILLQHGLVKFFVSIFMFVPVWVSLNWLLNLEQARVWLIFLFCLIWGADTSAYFFGKFFGKNKLCKVSPGKTWQGVFAALITSLILPLVFLKKINFTYGINFLLIISLFVTVFSIIGDLVESLFKRMAGVKDSGCLLPGHGGVLDRIDSLIAAVPILVLGLQIMRYFHA